MYYNWYSSYLAAQYNSDADFICVAKPKNDPERCRRRSSDSEKIDETLYALRSSSIIDAGEARRSETAAPLAELQQIAEQLDHDDGVVHAANGKPSIDSMVYEQCPADADAGDGN